MPVETTFCDQCNGLECDDPDVCDKARKCQVAANALRDFADVVEAGPDLVDLLDNSLLHLPVLIHGRTNDEVRAAYQTAVDQLGPHEPANGDYYVGVVRQFGPLGVKVYADAEVIGEGS